MIMRNEEEAQMTQSQGGKQQVHQVMQTRTDGLGGGNGNVRNNNGMISKMMSAESVMMDDESSRGAMGAVAQTNQMGGNSHIVMNQQQHVKMKQAARHAYGGAGATAPGVKGA